jgi:hemerythrin-like domain-containing protein
MRRQLNRNIKDVIAEFPAVERVLAKHGIGCATCAVGTCLLKDIIDVHGLSVEQEREVVRGIAEAIYPDRKVKLPQLERKAAATGKPAGFSPPVRALVEEHVTIKRLLGLVPWISSELQAGSEAGFEAAAAALAFIRGYADRFHHAKEEDILFSYFDPGWEIIASMRREHEIGRSHVREMAAGVEARDGARVAEHILAYRSLLEEHIRKEDEVLFPFLDGKLSMSQVGEMFSRFSKVEREFGQAPSDLSRKVERLEERAQTRGAPTARAP